MVTLNDSLMALVSNKIVAPEEAHAKAADTAGFEGMLKGAGIDATFTMGSAA